VDWLIFTRTNGENIQENLDGLEFEDNKTTEYHELIEAQIAKGENIRAIAMEEEVDIDDI
jgi:hypothetical protein